MVGTALLVDSVRKSILQCFCRTCQVTILEKTPPASCRSVVVERPPKKTVFLATEVRATEESKGGMKYELVLSEPVGSPRVAPTSPKNISVDVIASKLKAAEERRQSLEAQKLNQISEKFSRMQGVNQKKQEMYDTFKQNTRESLELKMECNKENREAYLKSIQEKMREHVSRVEEVRKVSDSPKLDIRAIKKKLDIAAEARETQITALQRRLKEHDKHIADVRKQIEEQSQQLRERLEKKLEAAQENRELIFKELQEKLQDHKRHVFQVRQANELNIKESVDIKLQLINRKLDGAEAKRLMQLQVLQEKLQGHERHIEEVRQNKTVSTNGISNSSG